MSFVDFKEISINNPGTSTFYGSDDLNEIMRIFNNKIISNRKVRIKNEWEFTDHLDIVAPGAVPANPGAATKRLYVDPADVHLKMKSTGGTILDFDVLGAGAQGEANSASNIGTAGEGFFKVKVGIDLQFRKLNVASNKLSVALDSGNDEIDIDVVEANLLLQNIGGTLTVAKGGTGLGTLTSQALLKGNGTGNVSLIPAGTDGHLLTMVSGAPAWASASASSDVKTAVFEAGVQIGAVGRRINFPIGDDFTITEDSVNDRFDIKLNRRETLVASWQNAIAPGAPVGTGAFPNVGATYVDAFTSNGDGVGFDIDGTGMNDFRFYVSWNKNGGIGTHSARLISQTSADVLAEIANVVNGRNALTGTMPAFWQDAIRRVKLQIKSTNSTDDPILRGASLYYK